MNLSRHFTLAELTRTSVVPPGGNEPPDAERANLEALCTTVLDPLRDAAGAAIKVSSGYRGPAVNARVGGASKSQHLEGRAADIQPTSMSVLELFQTVVRLGLPFDQVIYENKSATSKWVHVSHAGANNRGEILLAHFSPGGKLERYERVTAEQALSMVSRTAERLGNLEYDEMADEPSDEDEARPEPSPARVEERPVAAKTTAAKTAGKKAAVKKKATVKKTTKAAKKTPAKKSTPAKRAAKKAPAKKAPAKKAAKKSTPKKVAAKKPAARKSPAKAKKSPTRKSAKPAAKKRRD